MIKNLKFVSMVVLFSLLFQLNAFALSDDTSGKQPDGETIIENEIPPELICPTVPPPTPTAIATATASPVDDYGDTFSDAFSVESDHKIIGNVDYYGDVDVFSFVATSKSCYIYSNIRLNSSITLYNKSHELIEKTYAFDQTVASSSKTKYYSSIIYNNFTIGDTYYLKVEAITNSSWYSMDLHPFTDEFGNTYASAQIISANTLVSGKIDTYGGSNDAPQDIDVFAFIPETSGTYSLDFDSNLPINFYSEYNKILSYYIVLEKLDENSKPILLKPEIYNSKYLNYDLIKGETYYLTVKKNSGFGYKFSFNGPLSSSTPTILPTTLPTQTPPTTPPNTPRKGMIRGDVNDDGDINAVDFALLRLLLLGKVTMNHDSFSMYRIDLNSDGGIDAIDFALLRKYLLGMIDSF